MPEPPVPGKPLDDKKKVPELTWIWPRFIELWMFLAIAAFFVIRIVNSAAAHRIFAHFPGHRP